MGGEIPVIELEGLILSLLTCGQGRAATSLVAELEMEYKSELNRIIGVYCQTHGLTGCGQRQALRTIVCQCLEAMLNKGMVARTRQDSDYIWQRLADHGGCG